MNTEKSFVTCYDKDWEEYAEILMTLVSKDKSLRNVKRDKEEFKKDRSIVSDEYVLTIGKKSSEYNSRNFKDIYNNYGIHIGYHGAKAWIHCDDFDWDKKSQFEFNKGLFSLLEELGMKTEDFDEKTQKLLKKYIMAESQEKTAKGVQDNNDMSNKYAPVLYDEINAVLKPILNELIIDCLRGPLFLIKDG